MCPSLRHRRLLIDTIALWHFLMALAQILMLPCPGVRLHQEKLLLTMVIIIIIIIVTDSITNVPGEKA